MWIWPKEKTNSLKTEAPFHHRFPKTTIYWICINASSHLGSDRNLNRWGMSNLTELHEVTSNSRFEVRLMQKKKTSEVWGWGLRSIFLKTRHSQPQFRKFGKCKQTIFFLSFSVKAVKMASQNTEKRWFELGVLKFCNFSEE